MNFLRNMLILVITLFACSTSNSNNNGTISKYDFSKPQQIKITSKLTEISDLTTSGDDFIFAINDEVGIIYKLEPKTGEIVKRFFLGRWTAEADFEGIAISEDFLYTITSGGILYKFKEGNNEEAVDYEIIKLPFSSKFNIEGLYYDSELNGLLVVPKEYAGKKYKNQRAIYLYSFNTNSISKEPILLISLSILKKKFSINDFYPSGITKHPLTKNYIIISARGDNAIVEIDKKGEIIAAINLKEKTHRQPEGITILSDLSLLISDEGAGKKPTITRYLYKD